ncbi:ATP-binding protein [Methanolobus profundi]|uniref:ATP-binding protein n=1 Tax=Methanolobus profundi TaxID=487685 RepID=UPI001160A6AC
MKELSQLEDIFNAPSSSLVVFYGRRRVGKTELSKEFVKNKKAFTFLWRRKVKNFYCVIWKLNLGP